jgi:hypothetical protein
MTVVNGIEINAIYKPNDIKLAIKNNQPIEKKLNVIIVISNPCLYLRRYILANEFIKRIEEEETNVNLFVVEMIYPNQSFIITNDNNKNHLQLKTETPIWHKENMINLAVKYLLPKNWKSFAWVDADIEFENITWANDTLKILNGSKDIVQLFSHCVDLDKDNTNLNLFNSFGYSFSKNKEYTTNKTDFWHPGFAWAITKAAYLKMGGLFDKGILGSGDSIMSLALINKATSMNNCKYHPDYNKSINDYQKKCLGIRLGYIPGVIRHYYHGTKENRQYMNRWQIMMNRQYSPKKHLTYDLTGILITTELFSNEFKGDIMKYFQERKEDD